MSIKIDGLYKVFVDSNEIDKVGLNPSDKIQIPVRADIKDSAISKVNRIWATGFMIC